MNQIAAFDNTIALAQSRYMSERPGDELGLAHLRAMRERITPEFSPDKLGRWLGWAQAAVVAAGCGSLEDFKRINQSHIN